MPLIASRAWRSFSGDGDGDGWHLGNFPQVFSHLALINACVHLIREDERIAAG